MIVELKNGIFQAMISSQGAELISFKSLKNDQEFIWQGDPNYWKRHAPVLFPIVGRLKGDTYYFDGKDLHLGQHGFARDREFELISQSPEDVTFLLQADRQTLNVYPFHFKLYIRYELKEHSITTSYQVVNTGNADMYFSIGAHPAFRCPLSDNKKFDDYYLKFNRELRLERYLLDDGLLNGQTEKIELDDHRLKLDYTLFEKDAIVLKKLKSDNIVLQEGGRDIFAFRFYGFPYFGIWTSKSGAPFICLEPWHGIADHFQHNQRFVEKEGVRILNSYREFNCQYSLEILDDLSI